MPLRSRRLAWPAALLLAILACSSVPLLQTAPPLTPTALPPQGRGLIAYTGADGNIYTFDPNNPEALAITTDAQPNPNFGSPVILYRYPAWSPDGRFLSFVSLRSGGEEPGSAILVAEPGSDAPGERREIYANPTETPFYTYWSPDSASLTFLVGEPDGPDLELRQAFPDGSPDRLLDTGQPYYWHWSPDAARILVHAGGRAGDNPDAHLAFLDAADLSQHLLDIEPGLFQAPAWAPDGDSFLSLIGGDGSLGTLTRFDGEGSLIEELFDTDGLVAFNWSPDGSRIAVHEQPPAEAPFGPLVVLDAATGEIAWRHTDDLAVAYFWSPDGTRLAFFHLSSGAEGLEAFARPAPQETQPSLQLSVVRIETGEVVNLAAIVPTFDFLEILPFFDQYQYSLTFWSPDSRTLVYNGVDADGVSAVWLVEADGGAPPQRIFKGSLAIWSPR